MGNTFVEAFLDGFAFSGVFSRTRRPDAPTQVFASEDIEPVANTQFVPNGMLRLDTQTQLAFARAKADQAEADLARAKADMAEAFGVRLKDLSILAEKHAYEAALRKQYEVIVKKFMAEAEQAEREKRRGVLLQTLYRAFSETK